jgi:hypothetical protein
MNDQTPWQRYKDNLGETRPWDLLNPATEYVSEDAATSRLDMCKICPEYLSITSQCKKCGCIMPLKTKIANATCPMGKW